MMKEIYITDYNCITPLGFDVESNWKALLEGKSGVALHQVSDNLEVFLFLKSTLKNWKRNLRNSSTIKISQDLKKCFY